jgi:hypothetical protein
VTYGELAREAVDKVEAHSEYDVDPAKNQNLEEIRVDQ